MALFSLHTPPVMEDPVMIMGLAGWGDAASAASDAADWLAEDAPTVVSFDPDAIFDYRSNRPVLRISGGELISVTWPKLEIVHIAPGGRDVLVMVGNEPDYAWAGISDSLADIAGRLGVSRLITVGAVPTPVRHAREATVFCTASDSRMLLPGDEVLMDEIVVPASATTVFRAAIEEVGIPAIGYWAQVPQYIGRPYHPAIASLLRKVEEQLSIELDYSDTLEEAVVQIQRLDEILERRDDAREFVEGLGLSVGTTAKFPDDLPTADEIADEVAKFLRDAENDEG